MKIPLGTPLAFLLYLSSIAFTTSSPGDRSKHYVSCINSCPLTLCPNHSPLSTTTEQRAGHFIQNISLYDPAWVHPDPVLRLFQWDCISECKYTCMYSTLAGRLALGSGVTKFYGKWPFTRILGMQEIVSSLTSFANAVPHAYYLGTFKRRFKPEYSMYTPLRVFALICINSWFWSGVFHARDTRFTEACDYFFATSQLLYSSWFAAHRILHDYPRLSVYGVNLSRPLGLLCLAFYAYYVHYMSAVKFDYGLHMKINIALVVSHYIFWVIWTFILPTGRSRPYRFYVLGFLTLILAAASCEVFDFPPRPLFGYDGLLDAHACWHSMTVMMIPIYYMFWQKDWAFERDGGGKKQD